MSEINSYKDLQVWQKGVSIAEHIYTLCLEMPSEEKYGLASQMKRAAVSIPSNIAEGFIRQHINEYIHFLYIAYASAAELETQLFLSKRVIKGIPLDQVIKLEEEITILMKMLNKLIQTLKARSKWDTPKPKT